MVDLEILSKYKIDPAGLKEKFNKPKENRSAKINTLIDRFRARVQAGRDLNVERYQVYYALDQAWDAAFKQITPTLLASLTDKDLTSKEEVLNTLKQWGMDPNEVIREIPDAKNPSKNTLQVDAPAFFRIFVPLVAAYVKIRWAKLINDRRMVPLLKFEPVISDEISRLKCDTLTARIETMSRQFGYFDTLKLAVFQMLHYSECVQFVQEEWHTQCSLVEADSPLPGELYSEKAPDGTDVKKVIVKEGLRYHLPHPTRRYMDRAHLPSTLNSDTGVDHLGYWRVMRWADVMNTEGYYNLDAIGYDDFANWFSGRRAHSYWKNTMSGCSMNFPDSKTSEGAGGQFDAEKHVANWYSQDMADRPIVITEHFEKLVPKDHDLGDYPYPVWFRFVIAADNNIIYAAPLPYVPAIWYGYDYAEGRTHNASMSMEVLPFQDQFTNLLTQLLLTTRQNLANVTLMDSDIFDEKEINNIRNWGEKWYRNVVNLIPISFRKFQQKQGSDIRQSVVSHKFPMGDTNSIMMSMKVVLDTLERVLVMSAQEVGQSASHEQTREEVRNIAQNTSTRVVFTSIGVDSARDAWKRQLYPALMAYGQSDMWAQVPMEQPMDEAELNRLGFTVAGKYDAKNRRQYVKANKTALAYESFASDRDGEDRVKDGDTAAAMMAMLDKVLSNQMLAPAVGADQAIAIMNQIAKFAGFPRDFKLVNTGEAQTMQDQVMQAMQELKTGIDEQLNALNEDIQGALGPIVEKNMDQDVTLKDIVTKLNGFLSAADQIEAPSPEPPTALDSGFPGAGAPAQTLPASPQDMMMAMGG